MKMFILLNWKEIAIFIGLIFVLAMLSIVKELGEVTNIDEDEQGFRN